MSLNICTIIAKNYVAHARALARSYREHYPDGKCYVLIVDDTEGYIDPSEEPFELVRPTEIGIEDYERMISVYDVVELSTAVKPWLLKHLLKDRGEERIVYFDPDIQIFSRLDELEWLVREHELVLTPHVTSPMPRDGERPSEADILIAGTYNLGFMALENTKNSIRFLDWWSERLAEDCIVAPELGYFVDQRWIDLVYSVMPGFCALNAPGYNVAYWNLHGRSVRKRGGGYVVNGEPLQFFHFSGFSPDDRTSLSKHQSRIRFRRGSALARLCDDYADALLANGVEEAKGWLYTYSFLPNGVRLDPAMHRIYRRALKSGEFSGNLFTHDGADEFVAWLDEPARVGGAFGVTRYLYEVYLGRADLRAAFPSLDGPDARDLLDWARDHGGIEIPLKTHPALEDAGRPQELEVPTGVNVAGYFRSELGVGEVARQLTGALHTQNVPVATVGVHTAHSRQGHDYDTDATEPTHPVNIVCVNADALPDFATHSGMALFRDRYTIGMWWWEVDEFPERFSGAFDYVDEVWVGSHHVADAISRVSPVPVVKVTVPLQMPEIEPMSRRKLGLPEGFLFLFSFDFHSVFERKNPLATVEAFKRAFPEGGSGASLVIKSINGEAHPEELARLKAAAGEHPDVYVRDGYVSFEEKNAMSESCDCYVSLHRSEGFGFTMAEPMYLGKPVIATGYSGNLDFMNERNSYLVDYRMVEIGEGAEPYPPTGHWAEPDTGDAARLMRRVFENPDEARERGERAARDLKRTHSPEAAGEAMEARLSHILKRSEEPASSEVAMAVGDPGLREDASLQKLKPLQERILRTPEFALGPGTKGKVIGLARRTLLKFEWPYAMQQRTINDQLLAVSREAINRAIQAGESIEQRLDHKLYDFRDRISGLRALPYVSGHPFETYENEEAGKVQGFGTNGTDVSLNGATDGAASGSDGAGEYAAFEDIFRGSEDFIRARQTRYVELLESGGFPDGPVLDAGCGRGEFLDLMRERKREYAGVDLDEGMVERCRRKGHESVKVADVNAYLEGLADDSLGVVFCAQVIEHLPHEELKRLFALVEKKLTGNGVFIAETVNPHSVGALKSFWVDPTHQHPIFPEVTLALAKIHGFASAYVFHPNGTGDIERDRFETGEYALVARKAGET